MFLFTVYDRFMVKGHGLILTPGLGDKKASIGDTLKIIKPDHSIIEATIKGIGFTEFREILLREDLNKEDIPIGSEVWLTKEH